MKKILNLLLIIGIATVADVQAQTTPNASTVVTSAVPFLRIPVDARSAGMGDLGVATSPDNNSDFHNPSKYAFIEHSYGFGINYSPWLRQLVNDIHLISANGFYRIDKKSTMAAGLRYFSLGKINFTDQFGTSLGDANPNELAFDVHYARKLSQKLSIGVSLRYIYSNLAAGLPGVNQAKAGHAVAGDLSMFYTTPVRLSNGMKSRMNWGLNISNIGNKMTYTSQTVGDYLPANFSTGVGYELDFDDYNTLNFSFEINKLMVPTPDTAKAQGNPNIYDFKEKGTIGAIFSSWGDAPGGFSEELKEYNFSFGAEYWYNKLFAVRAGYFYESATKGGRNFMTAGLGLKYNSFVLNFSYLIPTSSTVNPLDNTMRFSLLFNFGQVKKAPDDKKTTPETDSVKPAVLEEKAPAETAPVTPTEEKAPVTPTDTPKN